MLIKFVICIEELKTFYQLVVLFFFFDYSEILLQKSGDSKKKPK